MALPSAYANFYNDMRELSESDVVSKVGLFADLSKHLTPGEGMKLMQDAMSMKKFQLLAALAKKLPKAWQVLPDEHGNTLLNRAVSYIEKENNWDAAWCLMGELNDYYASFYSPEVHLLRHATELGNLTVVNFILETYPNLAPFSQAPFDPSLLVLAVYGNNTDIVERVLHAGAVVDAPNSVHRTALHIAAQLGHCAIIQQLLEHHASLLLRDEAGMGALEHAVMCDQPSAFRLLCQAYEYSGVPVDMQGLFWEAVEHDSLQVLQEIYKTRLVDINARDCRGRTPLHIAMRFHSNQSASMLLSCDEIDWARADDDGLSAMEIASPTTRAAMEPLVVRLESARSLVMLSESVPQLMFQYENDMQAKHPSKQQEDFSSHLLRSKRR